MNAHEFAVELSRNGEIDIDRVKGEYMSRHDQRWLERMSIGVRVMDAATVIRIRDFVLNVYLPRRGIRIVDGRVQGYTVGRNPFLDILNLWAPKPPEQEI